MLTAVANLVPRAFSLAALLHVIKGGLMLSLESQRVFQNLLFDLFCKITNHLMTGPFGTVDFVSLVSQGFPRRFLGNRLHCSSRDQSLSVNYYLASSAERAMRVKACALIGYPSAQDLAIQLARDYSVTGFSHSALDWTIIVFSVFATEANIPPHDPPLQARYIPMPRISNY